MARGKEKLSAIAVEKSSSKPGMYCDGGGLWLRVSSPTACSWVFRFMLNGKAREMGLGKYGQRDGISLLRAREKAAECRRLKAEGHDPIDWYGNIRATKSADTARAITFKQCAEDYIKTHRTGWKNEKHTAQWLGTLENYIYPIIGALKVQEVDTGLVLKVLQQENKNFQDGKNLWNARPETASRVRGRIEAILDWATAREYRKGENPARWKGKLENLLPRRSKVARVEHHPALPYAKIGGFMAMIRENNSPAAHALEFCILTAARTSEVLNATWDEFSLKEKIWVIPAERMKAGKEHRIPISQRAIEILEAQSKGNDDNFVFRNREGGALSNMAMLMLLRRMEKTDIVVHGFRSTFRDWAGETTSHPREVIEFSLAHQLKDKVEAAYARGSLFEKRRALMNDWAAACATPTAKKKARK